MAVEFNPQEVKDRLAQSLESGELRKILYRQEIQQDEPVLLSIKVGDTDVVQGYNIPTIIPPVAVPQTQISFDEEMKNFLNDAETSHGLLNALYPSSDDWDSNDDWDPKIDCNYIFDIPRQNRKLEFESGICRRPPPPHICR